MANINRLIKLSQIVKAAGLPLATLSRSLILSANLGSVFGSADMSLAYGSAAALDAAWAAGTPARAYGDALFIQQLVPDSVRVGKLTVGPLLTYLINIPGGQLASTTYALRVNATQASTTTSGSPASDDAVTALKTQIDAASIAGLTTSLVGSSGTKSLQLQWDATHWGTLSLHDAAGLDYGPAGLDRLEVTATTANPGTSLATQLDNIRRTTDDFFFVLNPYPGSALSQVIATWCAANDKMLIQADPTSALVQAVPSGATDLAAVWMNASMRNAAVIYHSEPGEAADAAWVGGSSPAVPGTETWFGRVLAGPAIDNLNDTQINNLAGDALSGIVGKNGSVYVSSGVYKTVLGATAGDGTPIDLVRFSYAFAQNLKNAEAAVIANAQPLKVPGNIFGSQQMYGAMLGVFEAFKGPTKAIESYTLGQPIQATIANRIVTGFPYTIKYNGAIQGVVQTGLITQ